MNELYLFDGALRAAYPVLCGVDEAGRGPLAGDVYAAAVILPPEPLLEGLDDSKKLSAAKRDSLYDRIREVAVSFCVATASVEEIEKLNILEAAMLAMRRAVCGLSLTPDMALIDGNRLPQLDCGLQCVIKGDAKSASIAAASILAKVERDRYMLKMAEKYPQYGFEKHKGYGTKLHYEMLDKYGASDIHRTKFLRSWKKDDE